MLFSCSGFKLDEDVEFKLNQVVFSSNKTILQQDFSEEKFSHRIGKARLNATFKEPSFGYYNFDFAYPLSEKYDYTELMKTLGSIEDVINYWWAFLWFAKDNSSYFNEVFVNMPEDNSSIILANHIRYSTISGDDRITTFNRQDIELVNTVISKYSEYMKGQKATMIDDFKVDKTTEEINGMFPIFKKPFPYNQHRRIERAWSLLTFARTAHFLPMKIAFYIPILECLFSSDNTEIKHKVAERSAYYLGGTRDEKINTYNIIGEAYDLRSKFLHGDKLSEKKNKTGNHNNKETQIEISKNIDDIVRKILTKVIMEDSDKFIPEDINAFYKELIFN